MSALYNFGLSQEDERTEARALKLCDRDHILCVASAGEMPLSLLALGASRVVAVDTSKPQLFLVELKLAAVRALLREDALRFLGYVPCSGAARKKQLRQVLPLVSDDARAFWTRHESAVKKGVIWAGRYERYMGLVRRAFGPLVGSRRLEGLFRASTLEEQCAHFDREIARPSLRRVFRLVFHPRLFRKRGMDPRSLKYRDSQVPLGDQFFEQFRKLCTGHLASDNPLLALSLLGRLTSADACPFYLSRAGVETLRARPGCLDLRHEDIGQCLKREPVGTFQKVQLSNLPDWLSQEQWGDLLDAVATRMPDGGRVAWRYIHVNRPLPERLRETVCVDDALGRELTQRDRFPFYQVVPASVARRRIP
ncbi:MAG: DUF3419 family protein [Deltaproteobacteria bacterium]|nr:DUF3419 family protein [Deltaproteobacteria bacterium]